ncbi:MAG: heme-degrading domain-containing protein [Notoacmeibacter sp.]
MNFEADIALLLAQESTLVFPTFDEATAWAVGSKIREIAASRGQGVFIDIRLWDRVLFTHAMAGTSSDNEDWVRRKVNVVKRFQTSSYRKGLELKRDGKVLDTAVGCNPMDYAPHGGGFPIRLKNGPIIGCITVSNLPQREDHKLAIEAISAVLSMDIQSMKLD